MHFAREGYPWIFGGGGLSLFFSLLGWQVLGIIFLVVALFVAFFFRDPQRTSLQDDQVILSPADGRVVTIEKGVRERRFLNMPTSRVGIFMSPLDVHVNRVPVTGQVTAVHYQAGKFRAAYEAEASEVNEQNALIIEDGRGRRVLMVQVAGMLARRIVCAFKGGEQVEQGDRCGMIMLGSRVDLYCPPEAELQIHVGQKVKAGETVIGKYL
jgi:phosphatidylserine decarboxylase